MGSWAVRVKDGSQGNYTTIISEQPGEVTLPSIIHKGFELTSGLTIDGEERFGIRSNYIKVQMCSVN